MKGKVRNAQIRAARCGDGWEAQIYLLPHQTADPALTHEEKMGAPVFFRVNKEQEALDEMMAHLKKYFRLEIEE